MPGTCADWGGGGGGVRAGEDSERECEIREVEQVGKILNRKVKIKTLNQDKILL